MLARLIERVRRNGPVVLWTPEDVNLGNFLYHWMHAHAQQAAGQPVRALRTDVMEPWLATFPRADRLVVAGTDVGFRDQRVLGYWQGWGRDFTREHLVDFVRDVLLDSPALAAAIDGASPEADVVVNVRRGDYYTDPRFRQRYAFHIADYVQRALDVSALRSPVHHVHVVSDDIEWCRAHLDGVLGAHAARVTYADGPRSPVRDLATLAAAPRLILTNSTFGYWGGYLSGVLHADRHADVVAPWFHARFGDHLAAEQLDPRWSVVRDSGNQWGVPDD
ncbi:hypothetical protein ASG76_00895 [Nocardioides sp. Soil774]|uniref:alpha-1,2-fucosyltransferase n=1 Tax=Nocardioides sp. Soil774 TaxID=1736408 RepID=UPI0006F2DCF9|nr:alpha-1,2-fucosyltransferase [Nocardioides sp. Soil774]KRE97319.1 hypothetical protein ASG76_00895 [Nocardioides sp. Soil774]